MKTLIIYLFSIFMITNINAQNQANYKNEILIVLKNKHEYEKSAISNKEKKNKDYKVQYTNSFAKIKNDKAVLAYIN